MPAGRGAVVLAIAAVVFGCGGGSEERIAEASRLAERSWEPGAEARLREMLSDPEPAVRAVALVGLAGSSTAGAEREILGALRDNAPQVRAAAARALALRPVAGAEGPLADLVRRDPSVDVRLHAAGALSRHPGPAADEALAAAVDDANDGVRLRAIGALSSEGLRLALGSLAARALGDVSWEVRAGAVRALARAESPLSWVPVEAARFDGNEFVRAAAFAAEKHLAGRGVPRSLPEEPEPFPSAKAADAVYTLPSVPDAGGPNDGPSDSP
jgi:HEAT repeat protein